ncbi:hypothetical protein GFS24_28050 [Chitinophaga sp. SYP-B3965]|uniref:hypothetical protein n=1 Tax=Chitinophaga sp. SYP-B3965 TaxID=2663120 RepID=UPI0013BC5977|nr:hypothetical protein [Chitinophaga sp. SYP-B3965]MRG48994.1 hypothetical protein [Chitinophaga sp. SYP-B3965]
MVPILINIILIDFFYQLHIGVLVHAIILMTGAIYLLMQCRTSLVNFFFRTLPATLSNRNTYLLRAVVILLPLILLATYTYPDKHPQFTGKYKVSHLMVNGIPVAAHSTKDSVLTTVYMDWQDDFVLEFNHYNNRYIGTYRYDPATDSLHVQWRYPRAFKTPFSSSLKKGATKGDYLFVGRMGEDILEMKLEKYQDVK